MATINNPCSFDCNPCLCPPAEGDGCIPNFDLNRPCFFRGQMLGADDLNALAEYTRLHDQILSRLLSGWGILGGLRIQAPQGTNRNALGLATLQALSDNPQLIEGNVVVVSAGAAIDALGRKLLLAESISINLNELFIEIPSTSVACEEIAPICPSGVTMQGRSALLVAEFDESALRPAPQILGGCSQDPVAACRTSRKREGMKFRLVGDVPDSYQFTGCIDAEFTLPEVEFGNTTDADLCRDEVLAFIDKVQGDLLATCCQDPFVVLGRVVVTSQPSPELFFPEGDVRMGLPSYTIINDSYPCRRLAMQSALFTRFFPNLICGVNNETP